MAEPTREDLLKQRMSEGVTKYSPELQMLELRKFMLTEMNDALADLPQKSVQAIALLRTVHETIIPIPEAIAFCDNYMSLSRSRDRMGRQEGSALTNRPIAQYQPVPTAREIEEAEMREQAGKQPGFWARLFGRRR